jgi:hypothetical protein
VANGGPVTAANDAKLRDFAIRAVAAQPLGYLRAVLGGLALSVEWPRHPYPDAGTVYFYYFHRTPYPIPADHSWVAGGTAYSDAVRYGHATPSRVVRPVASLIVGYQRVFYTYGPLFGLIMLTGLGGVLRIRRRPGRRPVLVLRWSSRGSAGSGGDDPPEPPRRTNEPEEPPGLAADHRERRRHARLGQILDDQLAGGAAGQPGGEHVVAEGPQHPRHRHPTPARPVAGPRDGGGGVWGDGSPRRRGQHRVGHVQSGVERDRDDHVAAHMAPAFPVT